MKYALAIVCLFFLVCAHGQAEVLVESLDGEAIPGARVQLFSIDASQGKFQLITDDFGKVTLPSADGLFLIDVRYLGFEVYADTVELSSSIIVRMTPIQMIEEMVVTAQNRATSIENAVQKITVLTAEQVQRSGSNNLADILNYQTGIRLSNDQVLGSFVDLGGVSGQNVKILIDGVPVIGRLSGSIDLSQINLNNVERIEIVEGPLSVNYGTNALAGTVNIITKKKSTRGFSVELNPYYETIGNYNLSGAIGYTQNGHSIQLDVGRNFFDGWRDGDPFVDFPRETLADTNRVRTWKPKEQYFGGLRYLYAAEKWEGSVYGKYFDELIVNRGKPSAPYFETAFDDYYHTARMDVGGTSKLHFEKSKLSFLLAYNDFRRTKNTYVKDLTTLNEVLSATDGAQDTSRFTQITGRLIFVGDIGKTLTYQVGADINHSGGQGRRIENGFREIGDYAGFVTLDWKVMDSLTIKPGVRYSYNTAFQSPLVPSLNILYRIKKLSFRASVASGFRAPDLKELYMDFVDINHNITGNKDLRAESSWNYSFYVNWIKPGRKNSLIKFEYGAYYNDIKGLITLGVLEGGEAGAFTYVNIGEYSAIGQQFSFIYRTKRLRANVNATYIGRYDPDSELSSEINSYRFSPEVGTQLGYDFILNRLHGNIFYKFNGALQNFSVNGDGIVQSSRQASYSILDASVTADFLKDRNLSLTIGAKNLLNVTDINVTGQSQGGVHTGGSSSVNAGRGTSVFLSLKYQLSINIGKDEK